MTVRVEEVHAMSFITRGFGGRRGVEHAPQGRVPPGQYVTSDFPVLSAGPTPRTSRDNWRFTVSDTEGIDKSWTWDEVQALPSENPTVDIHCVTKWSKLDTIWEGVSMDTLLADVDTSKAQHALAHSYGGYTTNIPIQDLTGGKAWLAYAYDGAPLSPEHGGPARLLVPHLYFWKSAKWVTRLVLLETDRAGFWESYGYHNYGDPWREQRYSGD
jgi:DMSO/TMAO reductase YedYZ molybdopterin-dependent catalytic subunit